MHSYISNRLWWTVTVASVGLVPLASGITPTELSARLARKNSVVIVDVRPSADFAAGHIPGAINIPVPLLPYKRLPTSELVVICADGLGAVDAAKAVAAAKVIPGSAIDTLAGGYAAWLGETHLSTAAGGVTREDLPVITYDRLVAANSADVMIVDLTTPPVTRKTAAMVAPGQTAGATATTSSSELIGNLAGKLGFSVFKAHPAAGPTVAAMKVGGAPAGSTTASVSRVPLDSLDRSGKLLVLVADNEADADAAARQLRSRGNYRFTILIGGTDAIRYEGKTGSGRMTGNVPAPSQP